MIYLALSWQNHPTAWRTAVRAAVPAIIVSWTLRTLTLLVGR
jgi:hypothetical protein